MKRIVCDTNTLVSGFLFRGNERKLLELIADGKIELFLSQDIINEFSRVLEYPKLKPKYTSHEEIMDMLLELCHIVKPEQKTDLIKEDPSDNKFLDCATQARADYIVSGDKHLLKIGRFKGTRILKTKEFLEKTK